MDNEASALALALGLDRPKLLRHLAGPLSAPVRGALEGWNAPSDLIRLHAVCDGFRLFGTESWNSFYLQDAEEYSRLRNNEIFKSSRAIGVVPIFGECPHYTSVRISDGVVVSTDWENEGNENGGGWLRPIAQSIGEYVATVILVREAYGFDEGSNGMPSDWWHPYAAHGTRYDLEAG